jgi:hypothetical protein
MSTNAPASRNGRKWYVTRAGSQVCTAAKKTRPSVTMPQNAVRARAACVVDAPSSLVRSSCDQLPFRVSQMP